MKEIDFIEKNHNLDISNVTNEVSHPNDWIIFKSKDNNYKLCIDYIGIKSGCAYYGLSTYDILSSSDDIILDISDDKTLCEVITDKYKYKFKQIDKDYVIKNTTNGSYKHKNFELISIDKNIKNVDTEKKYDLELDADILNFYIDGKYQWSKIISTRYTKGIYFVLEDKNFTVFSNGDRNLDILNFDGSLHKQIKTSMEYIETFDIIYKDSKPKILKLCGFVWQPIFMKQYIDIDTLFLDKIKEVTYDEYNTGYKDHTFLESEFIEPIQGDYYDSADDSNEGGW